MSDHTYNFNVTMTCGGCSGAVERVLKKLDGSHYFDPAPKPVHCTDILVAGVKSYDVSLDTQTAKVVTAENLDYTTVLEKIKKTGKKVNSAEADGVPQTV